MKKIILLIFSFLVLLCAFKTSVVFSTAALITIAVNQANPYASLDSDTGVEQYIGKFSFAANNQATNSITSVAIKLDPTGGYVTNTDVAELRFYKDTDATFNWNESSVLGVWNGGTGKYDFALAWAIPASTTYYGCITIKFLSTAATKKAGVQIALLTDVVSTGAEGTFPVNLNSPAMSGTITTSTVNVLDGSDVKKQGYFKIQDAENFLTNRNWGSGAGVLNGAYKIEIQDSGTYSETVTIAGITTTSGNTLTLRAKTGQTPVIAGSGTNDGIIVNGVQYVTVQGLRIDGNWDGATGTVGVRFTAGANNGNVVNSVILDHWQGVLVESSTSIVVRNNSFYIVSAGGVNVGCVQLDASSSGTIQNNVLRVSSSFNQAASIRTWTTAVVSNYNIFWPTNGASHGIWNASIKSTFTNWKTDSGQDGNSLSSNPLYVNEANDATGNFHLKSTFGRWNGTDLTTKDNVDSPAIDAGDTSSYSNELEDNGNRIDQGAYGNTSEASLSGVNMQSCYSAGSNDTTINTWTGKDSTNPTLWDTANNWSKKIAPVSGDNVYIPERTNKPVLNVTTTVGSLTISACPNNSPSQSNGTLTLNNASYTLTVNNTFKVESGATYNQSNGILYLKGNYSNSTNANFNHTGGTVEFNGTGNQSITTDGDAFYNLIINNTGGGGTSVSTGSSNINVTNQLTLTSANALDLGTGNHSIANCVVNNSTGTITHSVGTLKITEDFSKTGAGTFISNTTITFNGTSNQSITPGGATFNNLTVNNTGATATVSAAGALDVNGNFTLTAGNFDLNSYTHNITDGIADTFNINGGTLLIDTSEVTLSTTLNVAYGGTLNMTGQGKLKLPTVTAPNVSANIKGKFIALANNGMPTITTRGTEGINRYSFVINGTGSSAKAEVDIFGLKFYSFDTDGLQIATSGGNFVTATRIDQVDFQRKGTETSGTYLNLWLTSGTYTFKLNSFDKYCQNNVGLMNGGSGSTANITMENSGGAKGDNDSSDGWTGESEDLDPDGDTHITWKYFKRWIGTTNTMWSLAANWEYGAAPKGVGCLTTTPPSCDDVLIGSAPNNPTLDANSYVNEIQITSGGMLSLSNKDLTVTGSTYRADDGTFQPNTGKVIFTGTATQTVNNALNPFWNLEIDKSGGTVNLGANLTVDSNVTLTKGTINLNGKTMTVNGYIDPSNTNSTYINLPSTSSLSIGATTLDSQNTLTLSGTATMTCAGVLTIAGSATLSGSSTLTANSDLIVSGTLNLQDSSTLKLNGSTTISGTFNTSGSTPTVTYNGTRYGFTVSGTINVSALNFSYADSSGLTINSDATIQSLRNINFTNVQSGGKHLVIGGNVTATFEGCTFDSSFGEGSGKIMAANGTSGTVTMTNYTYTGSGDPANLDSHPNGATITWVKGKIWAANYKYKVQLKVTNNGGTVLPSGAAVEYTFNHAALVSAGKSQADGDDIRIVYWTGGATATELDRVIIKKDNNTGWGTANCTIAFATQADIPASPGNSIDYWMYYGNSNASSPPANPPNAGVIFFDGFESGTLGSDWTNYNGRCGVAAAAAYEGGWGGQIPFTDGSTPDILMFSKPTSGFTNILIGYWRRGNGGGANEKLNVQWSVDATAVIDDTVASTKWTNVEAQVTGTYAYTSVSVKLPAGAENNANFKVRWRFDRSFTIRFTYIDTVRLYANQNGTLASVTIQTAEDDGTTEPDVWTNKWSEPFNWSPVGLPTSSDAVIINGNYTYAPTLDTSATILSLSVGSTNTSILTLSAGNGLTASGNITIETSGTIANSSYTGTITLGGNFSNNGSVTLTGSTVTFNGGKTQSITGSATTFSFNNLTVSSANTKVTIDPTNTANRVDVSNTLTIGNTAGTELEISTGKTLKITGATVSIGGASGGKLDVEPGATYDLADVTNSTTNLGGTFEAIGTATNRAVITSSDTGLGAGYSFTIQGTVNANYYTFKYMGVNGIRISGTPTITSLNNGDYDYLANSGTLLSFSNYDGGNLNISTCSFKDSGNASGTKYNVRASTATANTITFKDWSGGFAGEDYDKDEAGFGTISWFTPVTPDMTEALAEDTSGGGAGIQFGDTVTLTFNEATNGYDVSGSIDTILDLPGTKTWGTIVSADWSTVSKTNDTLTIALGSGATFIVSDSITILGTCGASPTSICDVTDTNLATGSLPNISGTFGADTPDMTSVVASDGSSGGAGIQTGDKVVIKFDKQTNCYSITPLNINTILNLSNFHTWKDGTGNFDVSNSGWSTSSYTCDTLTISLSTDSGAPTVALGDTITTGGSCGNAGTGDDTTICDEQGINKAVGSPPQITGTFGSDNTDMTEAVASDASGGGVGIQTGDKVVLKFDKPTNGFAINKDNIDNVLQLPANTWKDGSGNISSAVWNASYDTLTITLSTTTSAPTVAVGNSITIASYDTGTVIVSTVTNPTIVTGSGTSWWNNNNVKPGYRFRIPNDTNYYTILSVTDDTHLTLDTNYADTSTTGANYKIGAIMDSSNTNPATGSLPNITGDFGDTPTPELLSVVADDASGGGCGININDRVVFTFSAKTNAYGITNCTNPCPCVDSTLVVSGKTWQSMSASWNSPDNTILIITFTGGTPTVAVNDNVSIDTNTIEHSTNGVDVTGHPKPITGSFGDCPSPTLSILVSPTSWNAGAIDAGGVTVSTSGDKIIVTNDGNVAETFQLRISQQDSGVDTYWWTAGSSAGTQVYALSGIFCATGDNASAQGNFLSEDILTTSLQTASAAKFAYSGGTANGVGVSVFGERALWFRFDAPTSFDSACLSTSHSHAITVRIGCVQE